MPKMPLESISASVKTIILSIYYLFESLKKKDLNYDINLNDSNIL